MKKLQGATAWYLGAGLAGLMVLVAGWFLLVSPQQGTAAEIQATANAKASNVQTLQLQIAKLKVDSKNLPALQKEVAATRSHLPSTPSMSALLRDISNQAKAAGVILVGVTPQQPTQLVAVPNQGSASGASSLSGAGQVNEIPLTIQITGNFAHVRTFLTDIENLNRSILLTDVDITRGDTASDASSSKALKATLTGRTFMANAGSAADPIASLRNQISGTAIAAAN